MSITPYTCPQRTIRPVIQKDSVYSDQTPVQIEQEIQTEKDFMQKILKQGFELPQPISRTHSEPLPSGSQWTEPRDTVSNKTVPITNPNTVRTAHCNHTWEFRLALV